MPFYTYIIFSATLNRYYVGHCQDLDERIRRHNNKNGSTYTKKAKDWELKWSKVSSTKSEAALLELEIKRKKSRKYIEYLILRGAAT